MLRPRDFLFAVVLIAVVGVAAYSASTHNGFISSPTIHRKAGTPFEAQFSFKFIF